MALRACPDCGNPITSSDTTCPGCGAPADGVLVIKPDKPSVLPIIGGLIILGIAIATLWYFFGPHALGRPTAKLKASALAAAFARDESAAMSKYGDKVVLIEGKYTASDARLDSASIILDGERHPRGMTGVQCHFRNDEEASNIPKHETVKLLGRVEGLETYVQVENCERVF